MLRSEMSEYYLDTCRLIKENLPLFGYRQLSPTFRAEHDALESVARGVIQSHMPDGERPTIGSAMEACKAVRGRIAQSENAFGMTG